MCCFVSLVVLCCTAVPAEAANVETGSRRRAAEALHNATVFFRDQVATEGGYLWRYSEDLATREGEGRASKTTVWVQPPGTPSVGIALLGAYHATGDDDYLDAARQAGYCLVRGQLRSGGWDYRIEFDLAQRKRYAYRVDAPAEGRQQRNTTTLDDNTTQAALRLLMRLDETLRFEDPKIHDAAAYGLERLLAAAYPNGAWPQRFEHPPDAARFPVKKASYPPSWSRTFPGTSYSHDYTFNDNAIGDVIDVLFEASRVYGQAQYAEAARRAGDFILLAQMPEPQPGWAQQYDADMHPVWARKFEPPAITGGESQGVMRTLLQLYRQTGDKKYLEPIPSAVAYFRRSQRPDGRLARFYELQTNKPLYFTIDYKLTYSDADMPTHYAFVVSNGIDGIERAYRQVLKLDPRQLRPAPSNAPRKTSPGMIAQVEEVIASLDDRGRWVEEGRLKYHGADDPTRRVVDCRTFIQNVTILSRYLAAVD
ncbi:MAG: polysaccharide lyase [Pirellulales bacterium]|nr:polysaccharide lyase [Pirellulales bacterium]